ncbi:site-specific DNA-methyltransferase [uncultured Veillonella sp.]|uniref:site-specific DNA-methyltransferase n=1 Tax=uncultured Veillonella sp. TaxID=159268 RepID=UPI00261F75C6|nr:site-specific DNA-methyltransferase [uncultured Veillonella sp.]
MIKDNILYNKDVKSNIAFYNELRKVLPAFYVGYREDENGNVINKGYFDTQKFLDALKEHNVDEIKNGYHLDFVGKNYAKRQAGEQPLTVIVPDRNHNSKGENKISKNLFFSGDNLEVLRHLQNNYENSIDVMYIDPPYNTGSDGFIYPDKFEYSDEKLQAMFNLNENELARLKSIQGKATHSAWLTFMYPRLYLAKKLLKDTGVVFVSIDDHEDGNLRLLMDEIFGEDGFLTQIIWERAYAPVNLKKHFSTSHDYILCYAKNINLAVCNGLPRSDEANNRYSNPDNDSRGLWKAADLSVGPAVESNIYEITTPSGRKVLPPSGRSWSLSKAVFDKHVKDNRIWFGVEGNNVPSSKRFLSEVKQGITPMTIWKYTDVGHSQDATKCLKDLFDGKSYFDYPKPVELIKRCVQLYGDSNSIIMDFFAGSGTTADAVMQLNAEDKGKRQYILVQLPELIKENSVAYKDGYKTIDEITKYRLDKSISKIIDGGGSPYLAA